MDPHLVGKRCVLLLNGYEPLTPERSVARLTREFARSARTWNVTAQAEEPRPISTRSEIIVPVRTDGPNWTVQSDCRILYWGDMVLADFARPHWRRLLEGAVALSDFVVSGTAFRYFRTNWRYGAFFCYPIVLFVVFAYLATLAGTAAEQWFSAPALAAAPIGVAVFYALTFWPGRPLFFNYLLDDWIFARAYARGLRPDLHDRLDGFAHALVDVVRESDADEMLLAGHSLGAALSLDILARALAIAPDLTKKRRIVLLSTGSSLLKVALHPAADALRKAVDTVAGADGVDWVEYQSVVDIISFYKVDPVAAAGLTPRGKPILRTLRIRAMLEPGSYRRFRFDFFRLHRQLVMGNERRHFYDFFLICCGPLTLLRRVFDPDFANQAIGPDGALIAESPALLSADGGRG